MKKIIFTLLTLTFSICNAQSYFRVEDDYPDGYNGQYTANLETMTTYSDAEINNAFKTINNSGLFFNYPQGGCQNRAELMHIILEKQLHMQHMKIWIFAPVDLYPGDNRHLEIKDKNGFAINNIIKWSYHVAPAIQRIKDGKIETMIIDPSIDNSKPMLLNDWLASMSNSNVSKYTFLNSKWYFFWTKDNGTSSVINGFFYPYSSHWVEDFHRSTMERGLATNDLAKYLMEKLKNGYVDTEGSVKWFLANQDIMYNFFMNPYQQSDGKTKLLKNHSSMMREAEQYYWERLAYWQGEVNRLLKLP